MTDKFLKAVKDFNMISAGDSVCVAVSGGADSMCLLHLLMKNREALGITVAAAHVNHCIRGEEADRDEKYVRDYCGSHGITLHTARIDIPKIAEREGIGTEHCARNKRYEFFSTLNYSKTATAHTGSDCVETMLMNLSRGTSLHGLCSIPPVRGNIIRPLIYFTRDDTENYCRENEIDFVTDSTNLTDDYTRNKFRHSVLGLLKNINVSFEQNALRCLDSLRQDEDYLSSVTAEAFEKAYDKTDKSLLTDVLIDLHPTIAKRVLVYFFSEILHSECENKHINFFYGTLCGSGFVTLPSGIIVANRNGRIFPVRQENKNPTVCETIVFLPSDGFSGCFGSTKITAYVSDSRPTDIEKSPGTAILDADKISGKINVRARQSGDRITLAGRQCTKTLKKLFTEKKIPLEMRSRLPVFADADKVIFIPGIGISKDCMLTNKTKKFMIIKSECDKNDE